MELPIRFPMDEDVIAEEAARFRELTPESKLRTIRGMIDTGEFLMRISRRREFMREYNGEQEGQFRTAVQEFIARHAR